MYRPSATATLNTEAEATLLHDFSSILLAGGSETTIVHEIQRVKFAKNMWNGVFGASSALSRFSLRAFFRPPHLEPGRESTEPELFPPSPASTAASSVTVDEESDNTPSAHATAAIPRAAPAIGKYTIPFLHDALTEVYNLGIVLFPPSPSDEAAGSVPGLDPEVVERTLANTARLHARPDSVHMPSMLLDIEAGRPMEVEHIVGEVVRMGRKAGVSMPVCQAIILFSREDRMPISRCAMDSGWRHCTRFCSLCRIRPCGDDWRRGLSCNGTDGNLQFVPCPLTLSYTII